MITLASLVLMMSATIIWAFYFDIQTGIIIVFLCGSTLVNIEATQRRWGK